MKHLNEGLFEQDNWTYLIIEQKEHVNFFNNGYFSPNDYYKDDIDDNKFLLVNTNKNINSSQGQEFIKNQWKRKFGTSPQSVRCILSSNGSTEHAKYIKKIARAIDLGKVSLKDVMNMCVECDTHWENKVPCVYGKIFYGNIKENENIIKDMRRNNDKMLLEGLVRKYGVNGVKNAITNINESLSGSDYVEVEQIIRTLVDNQEQLNKLINEHGEPTPEFERILNVYDEYVLDVFYDILEADDHEWVAERAKRMAEDNEWENGTEASMLIDFLTDVANEINVSINESYKIDEKSDEDIILDRLSGKDPEPEMAEGLTDESVQYFKDDFYRALNDVAQKWEFRYICPSDDDWFNTLKWFLKEFRNRNF